MKKLTVYNVRVLRPDMTVEKAQTVECKNGYITCIRPYVNGEESKKEEGRASPADNVPSIIKLFTCIQICS